MDCPRRKANTFLLQQEEFEEVNNNKWKASSSSSPSTKKEKKIADVVKSTSPSRRRTFNLFVVPCVAFLVYEALTFVQSPAHVLPELAQRLSRFHCDKTCEIEEASSVNSSSVNVAFVSCGSKSRFEEVSVLVKSILVFSSADEEVDALNLIFFTDSLGDEFRDLVSEWQTQRREGPTVNVDVRRPIYPEDESLKSIQSAFAPCASLRLFFPDILLDYDRILYVDTDVVFLESPNKIWRHFDNFNASQTMGLIHENVEEKYNAYSYNSVPAPKFGLNSGVVLMDLSRMRRRKSSAKMAEAYAVMENYLAFLDQVRMHEKFVLRQQSDT